MFVNVKLITLPCFYTFISVDYIEFRSPITPLLPSLGIELLNDVELCSK